MFNGKCEQLCVSCPSANEFSAILFLLSARSSSNSPRSLEGFRRTLVQSIIQIRQRVKNFPIDPIVKIARFRQRYNVAESGHLLLWTSMGEFFIYCRIQMKFRLRVRLKRWYDRREFELDRARSKNNIAENSFALSHETHNSLFEPFLWKGQRKHTEERKFSKVFFMFVYVNIPLKVPVVVSLNAISIDPGPT